MPRFFAFLRAINVGGHNVTMEKLRGLFEGLGFKDVETFIASGNVIFTSNSKNAKELERKIEAYLHNSLGYEVKTFLRTESELGAIARHTPFRTSDVQSAGAVCVGFLAEQLTTRARKSLMSLRSEIDDFHINGREVYWLCKLRQSDSRFSNVLFEKRLNVRVTFRGINTVARLAAKYAPTVAA